MIMNNMFQKLSFFILLLALMWACNQSQNTPNTPQNTPAPPPPQAAPPAQPSLPKLDQAEADYLWNNCTYVDLVFYSLPFSMSIDNQGGIRNSLQNIANSAVVQQPQCKSIGRLVYQVDGNIVMEADVFYGDGCNYFVFYKDNKPVYANKMTSQGITYFTNILTKVKVQ